MKLSLEEVAAALGAAVPAPALPVTGWSVDSRTLEPGDLFFALRGPRHDGHRFVRQAFERGAVAAVVDSPVEAGGPLLPVADTAAALLALAAWARRRWEGKVVAVTGSAGKTTTKDLIAHLLATRWETGKTAGNLNNHVGLPLSILRLPEESRVAVLELGMNHPGEIRRLAEVARPEIGVITNVGYAHVEYFDSIDGVAAAKRELVEALPAGGTAVLNADDARVRAFAALRPGRAVTFGFHPEADVRAVETAATARGTRIRLAGGEVLETPLVGRHGVQNVLAALAAARALGLRPGEVAGAVRDFRPGPMRGERFTHQGMTVINDCYNSNPEAARAMLELLRAIPARRRIAVLGEMRELGRWAGPLHQEIGRTVAACGVDVLVGIRGAAREMVDAAVEAGLPAGAAYFFPEPGPAGDFVRTLAREGDAWLFKGSRATHVEEALERFLAPEARPVTGGPTE